MIIGFTGSKHPGLRAEQILAIGDWLIAKSPSLVVHGGCIGADAEFHRIARDLDIPIKIRLGHIISGRAICFGAREVCEPENTLVRNHKIVDECDFLIAAPCGPEQLRSGTWATIRYARKIGKSHWLV